LEEIKKSSGKLNSSLTADSF